MLTEEKKKNKNYGSIFVYCFFCFVLVVEVARFAKPYYNNLDNLMEETEAVVEEGLAAVESSGSGLLQCNFLRSRSASRNHKKLSQKITEENKRKRPPTTYCVKLQSFATMAKLAEGNGDKWESRPFSSGEYNWTLQIYPNANKPKESGGYVSMYVQIDNSSLLAKPHDVYAEIKFLVYRSTTDTYRFIQETDAQRFHVFKQKWGQPTFLPISYFRDANLGYIFDGGQSVFGVDIFVTPPFTNWEVVSYEENMLDAVFDWKLTKFSTLDRVSYTSTPFSAGGRSWRLKVYPNGVGSAVGNSLSVFLLSASNENGYVKAKLRVIDQTGSKHVEKQVEGYPNAKENGWGVDNLIPLADIKDSSKGFLVYDSLKVEVQIFSFSKSDIL